MHGGFSRLPWGAPSRPAPPRCRSLCCRLMASALFGMRAAPSRRNGGPRPSSALPLFRCRRPRFADGVVSGGQKPARPLRGSAAPPCARWPPSSVASGGGRPLRQAPAIPFFWSGGGWLLRGHSAAVAPFAGLAAGSQGGGACFSGLWPPRRCGGAPLRSCPAPRFWPRGGAILFSLRRVWGLRRLRAALKVYRTARAAQCKCGVHGFAMNPYVSIYPSTAPYYREARVTVAGRQTACEIAALLCSPH